MTMKIVPKTITGVLHNFNKGACDWGWQGLVAYGCQNCVTVIDPASLQVIQTLDKHKGYVVKVKWCRENYHHDLASPYTLRLASADYNGKIIVWDVVQASIRAEFADGSKPVTDLEWLSSQDASHDLLAALHPPHSLILWNAATGTKLWKKTYTEVLTSFSFDPFESSRLAFLGQDSIIFVDDFSVSKVPSSNGKKYYISSPSGSSNISSSSSAEKLADKKTPRQTLSKRVTNILVGESNKSSRAPGEDQASLNECMQLAYHQACRHHLILLYPREILLLDLDINQTVGVIPMERTGSPYVQVLPLMQRDVLLSLHENGSVSIRVRRRQPPVPPTPAPDTEESLPNPYLDVTYDLRCQSDPLRVTRHNRVYGITCCPRSEMKVVLVMSDSRVLVWELKTVEYQGSTGLPAQTPLFTPGEPLPQDIELPSPATRGLSTGLQINPSIPCPKTSLCDLIGHTQSFISENQANHGVANKHGVLLKFLLVGLLNGAASPPVVIRMCPPLTTKNWAVYKPLLALGTTTGAVQIYNLATGLMSREFSVHTCTVRGIEWVSLNSFLSYAYPSSSGQSSLVKNELFLTDIQTGKTVPFRPQREEESPIDVIKISYLKQYFVVVFKDRPFELWDLRTGSLLRQMPKNFPHVTALEWSPSHNLKSLKKRMTQDTSAGLGHSQVDLTTSGAGSAVLEPTPGRSDGKGAPSSMTVREHFVFTDADGLLYHFIVEGNMIKDGSKIPPDGSMGSITTIAWKAETLVLGDVDGNLNLWDLKARVSRAIPTHRGWVRKIKFAPGRGNMKLIVLYNDGADVWDAKDVERISTVKCPRDLPKVQDIDWAASDRPVLSCADGTVRVMDMHFLIGSSPFEDGQLTDPVLCPHLLPPKASMMLKTLIQHQPWNEEYRLHLVETEDNGDICRVVNESLQMIDSDLKAYLPNCHFGTAQRSLIAARLFGDESEVHFWTIALHYLRAEKADPQSKKIPRSSSNTSSGDLFIPTTPARETRDLVVLDDAAAGGQGSNGSQDFSWSFLKDRPLETCYDVLCDSDTFQKYQLNRICTHDSKRVTYEHTKKCTENLILLGQADRAVHVLLETESENDNYYIDSLRACLVASIRSSGASQSTIKLVATNLIANGKLSEGVQLLCLIDKGLDACRYLQTYGQWHQAAWLAKASLDYAECSEVMRRWAEHLATPQVNQKSKAVHVLLSLGQFDRVIETLYSMRHFDRAALFIEACQEFGLLDPALKKKTTPVSQSDVPTGLNQSEPSPADQSGDSLVELVFVEYARLLLHLGHRAGFEYYCQKAGQKGGQLLQDINKVMNK